MNFAERLARLKRRTQKQRTPNAGAEASELGPAPATVAARIIQRSQQPRLQQTNQERQRQQQAPLPVPGDAPDVLLAGASQPNPEYVRTSQQRQEAEAWEWSAPQSTPPSSEVNPQGVGKRIDPDILHSRAGAHRPAETINMLAHAPANVVDFFNRAEPSERPPFETEEERWWGDNGSFA
jgi:hypothetical protein